MELGFVKLNIFCLYERWVVINNRTEVHYIGSILRRNTLQNLSINDVFICLLTIHESIADLGVFWKVSKSLLSKGNNGTFTAA